MYRNVALALTTFLPLMAMADDLPTYAEIAKQNAAIKMDDQSLARARGEGKCLASIKAINSLPRQEFHPNIEWLRLRTGALLSHMRPCEVLIALEAAHTALRTKNAPTKPD